MQQRSPTPKKTRLSLLLYKARSLECVVRSSCTKTTCLFVDLSLADQAPEDRLAYQRCRFDRDVDAGGEVHRKKALADYAEAARKFDCRECDVEMTGVCFPKAQIRGAQAEAPLCYYCQYEQKLYSVTEATSSRITAVRFNFLTGETMPPLSLREVVRRALNMQERPIIQQPLNTLFNETCPLSLKNVVCPHMKKTACNLKEADVSLHLYSSNT